VGSLRVVADSSGNVVKRIYYDSFGNIIEDTDPSFDIPFGSAGGLHDQDTGLVRFGYRDYDPDIGRWTAKDSLLFQGGDTDLRTVCQDIFALTKLNYNSCIYGDGRPVTLRFADMIGEF
jgi:RHS repeat-associated protein